MLRCYVLCYLADCKRRESRADVQQGRRVLIYPEIDRGASVVFSTLMTELLKRVTGKAHLGEGWTSEWMVVRRIER